ncbi:MAG: DUF1572 domain-containing protein [Algicola sp.]|nr:DUF1572 domain-containing protein [Algicola sp.]
METSYLTSIVKQFKYYKALGDRTIAQLNFDQLKIEVVEDTNSVAIIIKHISGNMLSRWTHFLTEDGEKPWRQRDDEFIDHFNSKEELLSAWEAGWTCLFNALESLNSEHLEQLIYIRNQGHTVTEAINRQLAHYAYHVGQMVFLGKLLKGKDWMSLSIPKGKSETYNQEKFHQEKGRRHFTDDL